MTEQVSLEQFRCLGVLINTWARRRTESERQPQAELTPVLESLRTATREQIAEVFKGVTGAGLDLVQAVGYMRGPAVDDKSPVMWPVLAVQAKIDDAGKPVVSLRLALIFQIGDKRHVEGWRFETGESKGPHPYLHTQHIASMTGARGSQMFDGAALDLEQAPINEMRPAFPLRGRTCVGLMGTLMASLHGAKIAAEIVEAARTSIRNGVLETELNELLVGV